MTGPSPSASSAMVKGLLWDLGGVLCHFHPERRVQEVSRQSGVADDRVRGFLTPELLRRLDAGDVTGDQLLSLVHDDLGWRCDAHELGQAWVVAFEPNLAVIALSARVRAPAALLSNNGAPLTDQYTQLLPRVAEAVATHLFSGRTGLTKPDPAAFLNACTVLGVDPSDVLLIDDSNANVSAASNRGLRTHLYRDSHWLEALLHDEHLIGS